MMKTYPVYQTLDHLDEHVFRIDEGDSSDKIDQTVKDFFDEVVSRKRNEPFEGGLLGSMDIYPDKAGLKINENDGSASHNHTFETIAQYLDGDEKFSTIESMQEGNLKRGDPHCWDLDFSCFTTHVLAGDDELYIFFATKASEVSDFQLDVILSCVRRCMKMIDDGMFKEISIYFTTPNDKQIYNYVPDLDISSADYLKFLEDYLLKKKNANMQK